MPRHAGRLTGRSGASGQRNGAEIKRGPASVFKGNKRSLPSKPCVTCGRPMTWRKRWARSWEEVKFCSEACRKGQRRGIGE